MSKRYDVVNPRPRKNSDKPYWMKVGTAFEDDKGVTVYLDAYPVADADGRVMMKLFEARDRDGARQEQRPQQTRDALDDDLRF